MRTIDVQTDGSPIEIRVFDGDREVARHVVRTVGTAGELVLCVGGPGSKCDEAPEPEPDGDGWLPPVDLS